MQYVDSTNDPANMINIGERDGSSNKYHTLSLYIRTNRRLQVTYGVPRASTVYLLDTETQKFYIFLPQYLHNNCVS